MSCHVATVSALEEDLYYDGSNLIVRKELPNSWLPANQFHLRKQLKKNKTRALTSPDAAKIII